MFKETCLVAHKRIDRSPRIECLDIPRAAATPMRNNLIVGHTSNQYATNLCYECMK
jgi:hypothetical protein